MMFQGHIILLHQSKTNTYRHGHVSWPIEKIYANFTDVYSLKQSFSLFGHAVSEDKSFENDTNQKLELNVAVMFVHRMGRYIQTS